MINITIILYSLISNLHELDINLYKISIYFYKTFASHIMSVTAASSVDGMGQPTVHIHYTWTLL